MVSNSLYMLASTKIEKEERKMFDRNIMINGLILSLVGSTSVKGQDLLQEPYVKSKVETSNSLNYYQLSPVQMKMSVGRLRQDTRSQGVFFTSVANSLFEENLPDKVPEHGVYYWKNPVDVWFANKKPEITLMTDDVEYPTVAVPAPKQWDSFMSGAGSPAVVTSGRFPTPSTPTALGEVFLLDNGKKISISGAPSDDNRWFYRKVVFIDMNGDGRLDVLTARSIEAPPPFPGYFSHWNQLLWFEQPQTELAPEGNWPAHIIMGKHYLPEMVNQNPGLSFDLGDVDGDGIPEIVYNEFWINRASIAWTVTGDWAEPESITTKVIEDDTIGHVYSSKFEDINNDGRLDILLTNHVRKSEEPELSPSLVVYTLPQNFKEPQVKPSKIIIDDSFKGRWNEKNKFSIGNAITVPTRQGDNKTKPLIAITTDGGGDWYLEIPQSQDPDDWNYSKQKLAEDTCDFIEPALYHGLNGFRVLMVGCLGRGKIYNGVFF